MKLSYMIMSAVLAPSLVVALWRINTAIATAALGAIGYTCATGALPNCVVAAVASLIIAAMSSYNNGGSSGTDGSPVRRSDMQVVHFHRDGRVFDHVNTSALEVGVWHRVISNEVEILASKNKDGNNLLKAMLDGPSEGMSTRDAPDPNAIQEVTAQYGNGNWPTPNQWSQDEINDMASSLLNTDNLDAQTYCSTVLDDTDADTVQISWTFDTTNHYHTEFPPPCGA